MRYNNFRLGTWKESSPKICESSINSRMERRKSSSRAGRLVSVLKNLTISVAVLLFVFSKSFPSARGSISSEGGSGSGSFNSNNGINTFFGGFGGDTNSETSRPEQHSSASSLSSSSSRGSSANSEAGGGGGAAAGGHRHRHHHGNALQTAPVGGPNVCRSRIRTYCCPGWSQKSASGLCVIPICTRACGAGRCVKPNLCLCDGGTISNQCQQGSRDGGGRLGGGGIGKGDGNSGISIPESSGSGSNGCQISCLNGATCINNKCICRNGYSGEFCGEAVCRESCLNGGRCIGPDRCACVYGYTGRKCEADYRTGPCFTKVTGNVCGSQLQGVVCTRQLCCATVGVAWGHPCEPCPDHLDCEPGHLKNIHSSQCIDIDECEAIPNICEGGTCKNTPGSFRCECPPGQAPREGGSGPCEDENECLKDNVCTDGRCINTEQGYYCICDRGFIPSQDRKFCIDARQGNCFTSVLRGICRGKLSVKLTKRDCCCGMNMGKGWGDENNCEMCPTTDSDSHKLCVEPGLLMQIDECGLRPDICGKGKCIDIPDGYRCECDPGHIQRSPMAPCEDIDECIVNRHQTALCQGGRCVNNIGSYTCICPQGFDVSSDGKFCIDHDECSESGMCANGICINMDASFKCTCNEGYILSPTGHSCIDQNECLENPRICLSGRCENTPGSYKCVCSEGFTPTFDQAFCVDKNECAETGMCSHGRCVNLDGSFKCVCNPGYKLGPTGKHCVDLNECDQHVCQGGQCFNEIGSFKCECFAGLVLGPDGRTCLDTQKDLCFKSYRDGLCLEPSLLPVPKSTCCCFGVGSVMGWGTPCRSCPLQGTADYDMLCPHGTGMTHTGDDINECAQNPNICTNGACENLVGTYRCICDRGYQVDSTGKLCLDVNECEMDDLICGGGLCKNKIGSFQCICPVGTQYDPRTQVCQDIDECIDSSQEVCTNGRCKNTQGSFDCDCFDGFILDPTGRFCIDNRRGNCWTKVVGGKCEGNLRLPMLREECCCSIGVGKAWGSPCSVCDPTLCECQPGFAKVDGKACTDIDECAMNPGICLGGGTCVNTEGSFTCSCPPGLQLEEGGTKCIDRREEHCYMHIKHGVCQRPLEGYFLRADCCCTVGKGWGRDCLPCPRPGSEAMQQLCPRGPGSIGQKDVNECALIPNLCENGRCRNVVGSFTCRCHQGFSLDEDGIKCIDLDECSIMPGVCGNGTCRNLPGSFACDCEDGFESSMMMQTCMDKNECQLTPGLCKGGRCLNVPGSFSCICPPGLELTPDQRECKDIDECSRTSGICSNGVCENQLGTYQCGCNDGYRQIGNNRAHCEDINECEVNNGQCDSICLNTPGGHSCACLPGYMLLMDGRTCVDADECNDNRICNGGKCKNIPGSYSCECTAGLMPSPDGSTCLDVDECRADPGVCGPGRCDNSVGSFVCLCDDGFSVRPELGPSCIDEDECLMGNYICSHNAECINTEGSHDCRCLDGFSGDGTVCRDINECQVNNGGCHQDAQCINTDGSFRCACDPGFEGDGINCLDIDECSNNPNLCDNGQCLNHPGSFRCECDMGFMNPDDDDHSCTDINECDMFHQLCVFGRCENIHGMFRCVCNKGYQLDPSGGNCTDINECENPHSCLYGTCINTPGGFTCSCPPYYELTEAGNACVDRRKSQCYLDTGDDFPRGRRPGQFGRRECARPIGDLMTRATCCCSVGSLWGPLCEACPTAGSDEYNTLCPGGNGFRPNGQTTVLEDVEECSELSLICTHGKCTNTFGSFMCDCDAGYRLDVSKAMCIDRNECIEQPDACGVGHCINEIGGYHCICPEGYMLLPSERECVDMRKEPCYMDFNTTTLQCGHPMSSRQTKMLCCCSMGAAWGDACLPCPAPASAEYTSLCGLRPGQIVNPMTGQPEEIDECSLVPNMCGKGVCVNTPTSFRCDCRLGFVYDEVAHTCVDIDECNSGVSNVPCRGIDCFRGGNPCQGNAVCVNIPGSFECRCPSEGYRLDHSQRGCQDINECNERIGICSNGECKNFQGSFQCQCRPGFMLTPTRDSCIDIDECQRNPNMCSNNGTCVNILGSHKCLCKPGFKLSSNNDCEDMDECQMMLSHACRHGRCINLPGSFTCQCAEGYTLTSDGQNCRDVNECDEIPNTCPKPARCQNVMGSHMCTCPPGFELSSDGNYCRDLNECQINSNLCSDGVCINTDGGFVCQCPENYVLSSDGKKCVDIRQDLCYDSFLGGSFGRGVCSKSRRGYVSRMTCCCTGGKAWGSSCESCPAIGTREFKKLCPDGIGRGESGQDLDECSVMPDVCQGGECVNSDGSFRCECPQGYKLDSSGDKCVDENECALCSGADRTNCTNVCGNGTCFNVEGGFECDCNDGFAPGPNQVCEDIDECRERSHQCAFRCHNTVGGYRCTCPFGFVLAPDGKHCTDLDECSTPVHNCKFMCKNLIGSFACLCSEGYEQIGSGDDCRDINECAAPGGLCQNGRCINLPGSFRCECFEGFEPSQDYSKCIDRRQGSCYRQLVGGRCVSRESSSLAHTTKADCCCTLGVAWGLGDRCDRCPQQGTPLYKELCLESGYSVDGSDLNECEIISDLCKHGTCVNTLGSFRCICGKGFKVDPSGVHCLDVNECDLTPKVCQHNCENTVGSFFCLCNTGFTLSSDGVTCKDIDECATGRHGCQRKDECVNTQGSYQCLCSKGFSQVGDQCLDVNECDQVGVCPPPGTCINTMGSFKCIVVPTRIYHRLVGPNVPR
ncbi:fibrillin-2 isoform X2 [Folsomia candida]|uniref:fibrillin-2 isoform X2 n=1 Tax=Folsomia candida TaxID=158441 RepID=UPI001604AD17|nr:fibrillin-2 isoform X2 [Folsomia candida]